MNDLGRVLFAVAAVLAILATVGILADWEDPLAWLTASVAVLAAGFAVR